MAGKFENSINALRLAINEERMNASLCTQEHRREEAEACYERVAEMERAIRVLKEAE